MSEPATRKCFVATDWPATLVLQPAGGFERKYTGLAENRPRQLSKATQRFTPPSLFLNSQLPVQACSEIRWASGSRLAVFLDTIRGFLGFLLAIPAISDRTQQLWTAMFPP
jgi:hypothetical protein